MSSRHIKTRFKPTWGDVCYTWSLGKKRLVGKLKKNLPVLKMHQMHLESHLSILLVVVVGFPWFDAWWCWFMVLLVICHCNPYTWLIIKKILSIEQKEYIKKHT